MLKKRAIALLITVFFIMAITVSIGISLRYINSASKSINSEQYIFQSSIIIDDVLKLLKNHKELEQIKSSEHLAIFLQELSSFALKSSDIVMLIEISSARAKVNPNTFSNPARINAFKNFLITKMININYADILLDTMGKIKEDMSYNTDIFTQKPYLFRDYIASYKHLEAINNIYVKRYHDNSLKNIDIQELFYPSKDYNSSIDLNYATPLVWELMLGCDENRASMLSVDGGVYKNLDDLDLSDEEKVSLARFRTSFFEPYVDVKIEIKQKDKSTNIRFEYDIKLKRGSNFVFEI